MQLTKVDENHPDNKLSGAEYGGYFVKERTAPKGFRLDENAYYFEISEHGKTVVVENKAGVGFVNDAQVGSLKIIKTSSDGKVEGFSFRVTGPNGYEKVFTTNKAGEIVIEGLRVGEYRVSEVLNEKSSAYVLPADKTAEVLDNSTTTRGGICRSFTYTVLYLTRNGVNFPEKEVFQWLIM